MAFSCGGSCKRYLCRSLVTIRCDGPCYVLRVKNEGDVLFLVDLHIVLRGLPTSFLLVGEKVVMGGRHVMSYMLRSKTCRVGVSGGGVCEVDAHGLTAIGGYFVMRGSAV